MTRAELPLHRRTISVTAHEEEDGEISVEAELRDERPWEEPPGGVVHRMGLSVRIRVEDMVITTARADMRSFPHAECPLISPVFDGLVGLSVATGYNRAIQERFRGVLGCSHLYELSRVLGPAAVQAAMSAGARRRAAAGDHEHDPRATAGVLNSCHIWAPNGAGLRKLDAGWLPGKGPRPVPMLNTFERPDRP
ncbi:MULTISPECIES: DUF2889 domain-containing protein [unclassified Streptomyces]|uniref:DUF2889 domain-containing protein n=1 Tax=unclassified Streptomyces TaxID=2593676 RepID=UPI002E795928|nr:MULTISPECIES: DUF2889 domain-containing protein [unclassified Streptomyces]MEE1762804.1 DUF2889 domain-containing protein [Streptomyces sp. SP18BB07]MEE1833052.1 DUF2889 domain-containing protein [Streptomyces sp. SP17KL33]